jgi:hypothetical protein
MTNVHLFCADSIVTKFEDTATIIRAHGKIRLDVPQTQGFPGERIGSSTHPTEREGQVCLEVIEGKIVLLGKKSRP